MVEDENPPAYQPVALDADDEAASAPGTRKPADRRDVTGPVGSSFRGLNRLLRANGGFKAYFRGLACYALMVILCAVLLAFFSGILSTFLSPLGTLLASLAIISFDVAWVHIVITPFSGWAFWRRVPSFNRAFKATWRPVVLHWLATEAALWVIKLTAWGLGVSFSELSNQDIPGLQWKGPVIFLVGIGATLLTIPARVILVRVQASLLPHGEDTIIPFDRTFAGKVEPAVVSGKGYATISDVWSSFSPAAWRRLIVIYAKVLLITGLINFAIGAIIAVQHAFIISAAIADPHA